MIDISHFAQNMLNFHAMLYDSLKIAHILSAALLLTSAVYGCRLWFTAGQMHRLESQTGAVILPLIMLQLLTGFTLISLKHDDLSILWISSVVTAFIIMITSWLCFICFNCMRKMTLFISGAAVLTLIFLMASRS